MQIKRQPTSTRPRSSLGNLHHLHKEGLRFNFRDDFQVHLWPTCLRRVVLEVFSSNFASNWVAIDLTLFWFSPSLPSLCSFPLFVPWLGKPAVYKKTTNCVFLRFSTALMKGEVREITSLSVKGERKYSLQYTKKTCLACKSHQKVFSGSLSTVKGNIN